MEKEVKFECPICKQEKPITEMERLDGYRPSLMACTECKKRIGGGTQ